MQGCWAKGMEPPAAGGKKGKKPKGKGEKLEKKPSKSKSKDSEEDIAVKSMKFSKNSKNSSSASSPASAQSPSSDSGSDGKQTTPPQLKRKLKGDKRFDTPKRKLPADKQGGEYSGKGSGNSEPGPGVISTIGSPAGFASGGGTGHSSHREYSGTGTFKSGTFNSGATGTGTGTERNTSGFMESGGSFQGAVNLLGTKGQRRNPVRQSTVIVNNSTGSGFLRGGGSSSARAGSGTGTGTATSAGGSGTGTTGSGDNDAILDHHVFHDHTSEISYAFLDEDKIGKDETKSLRFGLASLQGRRPEMEDFYNIIPKYRLKKGKASLFAVYDGHGGAGVAELCSELIPKRIKKYSHGKSSKSIGKAIQKAFLRLDADLLRGKYEDRNDKGGSTAAVTIITKQVIVVGSVGDSRVVACVDGRARPMTEDHKPDNDKEHERVLNAGLSVSSDSDGVSRVRGLNMSRSIGDIALKQNYDLPHTKQAVIAKPSIQVERTANVSFIVLGCDGIFDVMSNDEVVEYVRRKLAVDPNRDLDAVALSLLKQCYHRGTGDNMTLIIVQFKR